MPCGSNGSQCFQPQAFSARALRSVVTDLPACDTEPMQSSDVLKALMGPTRAASPHTGTRDPALETMGRLLLQHDRALQDLQCIHCLNLLVYDKPFGEVLNNVRTRWQSGLVASDEMDEAEEIGSSSRKAHKDGLSLRSCYHAAFLESLDGVPEMKTVPKLAESLRYLRGLTSKEVDSHLLRLKPLGKQASDKSVWAWQLTFSATGSGEYRTHWMPVDGSCDRDGYLEEVSEIADFASLAKISGWSPSHHSYARAELAGPRLFQLAGTLEATSSSLHSSSLASFTAHCPQALSCKLSLYFGIRWQALLLGERKRWAASLVSTLSFDFGASFTAQYWAASLVSTLAFDDKLYRSAFETGASFTAQGCKLSLCIAFCCKLYRSVGFLAHGSIVIGGSWLRKVLKREFVHFTVLSDMYLVGSAGKSGLPIEHHGSFR
eukprot:6481590-Amphidinium_carterae.1